MKLKGMKIGILVEEQYNDREFWYPFYRLQEEGAEVIVIGPRSGLVYAGAAGIPVKSDAAADKVGVGELDGLIIPGGYAPDRMRRCSAMVNLVRGMVEGGKVVAAICHAGWMLASAKVLAGRTVTGFFAIRDDLEHAGARFVDQDVVVDGNVVTSRTPDDLPAFMRAVLEKLGG